MDVRRRWFTVALGATLTPAALLAIGMRAGTARAQVTISKVVVRAEPVAQDPGVRELPATLFATDEPTPAAGGASRLQKIQQLNFDRRPSAIFGAWSKPEGEAPKEPEKPAEPAKEGAEPAAKPDPFDAELEAFRLDVTRGRWDAVKAFLAKLPEAEGKAAYKRLVKALAQPPGQGQGGGMVVRAGGEAVAVQPGNPQFAEKPAIGTADVIAVAGAAPKGLDDDLVAGLGRLLRLALAGGFDVKDAVAQLKAGSERPEGERVLSRRQVAKLLMEAGQPIEAGDFLPTTEEAEKEEDLEALNLLSRHLLARHAEGKKVEFLERAWGVTQAVLRSEKAGAEQKEEALRRAVELAPKVDEALGKSWLASSFAEEPARGRALLAAIGGPASQGLQSRPQDPDGRLKLLQLQRTAVESLLEAAPERAAEWSEALTLLAVAWLAEAEHSQRFDRSTSIGPRMQRDPFGNIFFLGDDGEPMMMQQQQQQNMPRAIPTGELLKERPGEPWLGRVEPALRPRFAEAYARLFLKVKEEDEAFPHVERLAADHPKKAGELAEEFLRVWTQTHDPNSERNRTNPYMFMFGFERRAEGIPLTRSKQARNLEELAGWVARIRALPVEAPDEELLAKAFTTCHSAAEVYRAEDVEAVFGDLAALEPRTLARLAQGMRENLAGAWRQPAVQERAKTKRREKDIRAEVLRGYEVARATLDKAMAAHPDAWSLVQARAAVMHDENAYLQELDPGPAFAKRRRAAIDEFRRAAERYVAGAPGLAEEDETAEPFQQWFYAALGASDLARIEEKHQSVPGEVEKIKAMLDSLPGEQAERHRARFANDLFTRMSGLNPAAKFRYLEGGFAIVGDHDRAREARKVYDYYKDLVTEIKLDAKVDGPAEVGHGRPFGLLVSLRHTRDIERESGGFGKYLQNQKAAGNMFFYNYGRPLENYRDKFEEAARGVLKEQFEVVSVTFQDEKVNSRAAAEFGWRETPYAYILLKASGPEVDKIPPLRLDLDFLDTSGYVVLPVETPAVPIDAAPAAAPARPFANLELTQTLDERRAAEGRLGLEVKATARGLVPELDELIDFDGSGFEVASVDDQGVSVARFDPDADDVQVVSERLWEVQLRPAAAGPVRPSTFRFASTKVDEAKVTFQRYDDADLVEVTDAVDLMGRYERPAGISPWWWLLGLVPIAMIGGGIAWAGRKRAPTGPAARFAVPEPASPFAVLALLREIGARGGHDASARLELDAEIDRLERHYFQRPGPEEPDLRAVAASWVRRTA